MKMWKNITLDFPGMDLHHISDLLSTLDVASVMIKDKQREADSNWFDDPENPNKITLNEPVYRNACIILHMNLNNLELQIFYH